MAQIVFCKLDLLKHCGNIFDSFRNVGTEEEKIGRVATLSQA